MLSRVHKRNEPLGLQHSHARTSASSLPSPYGPPQRNGSISPRSTSKSRSDHTDKKRTKDGRFILEPQPDDSANDPLNWNLLRRDVALVSLGFYCMVGGGMTPVLAAGFNNVAETYGVSVPQVALTTGLYMLGLGLGSVIASPTAILFGKRPVYLVAIVTFCLSSVWCALAPNCEYRELDPSTLLILPRCITRRRTHCPGVSCFASRVFALCHNRGNILLA